MIILSVELSLIRRNDKTLKKNKNQTMTEVKVHYFINIKVFNLDINKSKTKI